MASQASEQRRPEPVEGPRKAGIVGREGRTGVWVLAAWLCGFGVGLLLTRSR